MIGTAQSNTTKPSKVGSCLSCGAARNKGDHCHYCDAIYLDAIKQKNTEPSQSSLASKYKISENENNLVISWGWGGVTILNMVFLLFTIAWLAQLSKMVGIAEVFENPKILSLMEGVMFVFGIYFLLLSVSNLVNKTTIVVNKYYVTIKHHPIPLRRNHRFSKDEIGHLFVSKSQRQSKNNSWDIPVLQLVKTDGTRHEILKGVESVEFADYESLRQRISKVLDTPLKRHTVGAN